jgi:NitT/TauT family transport system ATP-binding protein
LEEDDMTESSEPKGAPVPRVTDGSRVELHGVTKVYGDGPLAKLVVEDCSFTLEPGQVTVMVGPSGCGKSSIAFLIAGYERPTQGKIVLDGKSVG